MKSTPFIICGLFLGLSSFSFSQIVDIPDPYFKQKLLNHDPVIDTNGDNQIQLNEALALTGTLEVAFTAGDPGPIVDLTGIEAFENIQTLSAGYNAITQIDLSGNTALRTYNASGNLYTSLDFSNNPNLEFVQSNFGNLNSINFQNNPNLTWVHIQGNQLTSLDINHNPLIQGLVLDHNPIAQVDVTMNPMLRYLNSRGMELTSLDLSHNGILLAVDCQDNPNLTYINLKNGNNEGLDLSGVGATCTFYDLPKLQTVCVDEVESPLSTYILDQVAHEVTFTQDCLLSMNDQATEFVRIYPNPTNSILNIDSKNVIRTLKVYNPMGQEIWRQLWQSSKGTINIENITPGIYFLEINDHRNQTSVYKIVKS